MIKNFAIFHGSCNIACALGLALFAMFGKYNDDTENCLGACSGILYILSFISGMLVAINILATFGAWRSGDFTCSSALYIGELIYFCVVCVSCGMLCGIIPYLQK